MFSQLLTSVRWDSYSKITILPTRGRDDFNSSLLPPFILSKPYPQEFVQSYEFARAVFFNNKFESKVLRRCNHALLMFKIDGDNNYQSSLRAAIAYLYCPSIDTSSASLWQKLDEIVVFHSATFPRSTQKLTSSARDLRGESRDNKIGFRLGDLNRS